MKFLLLLFSVCVACKYGSASLNLNIPDNKHALDLDLFERVLDPVLCEQQVEYMVQNDTSLLVEFLDAGIRTPKGIYTGNLLDLGNYYQCLGINQKMSSSVVEGKYCMIQLPLDQDLELPNFPSLPEWPGWPEFPLPDFPWPELNPNTTRIKPHVLKQLKEYNAMKSGLQTLIGSKHDRSLSDPELSTLSFNLAMCLPKSCTPGKAISSLFPANTSLRFADSFCRLPNDKPFVPGDYVALVIFSLIGLLSIVSTAYDLHYHKYRNKDPKKVNKPYQSFSVYTNTRRLVTYTPVPGTIECLDGIRSFAMMWVIVGHTFVTQLSSEIMANPLDAINEQPSHSLLTSTNHCKSLLAACYLTLIYILIREAKDLDAFLRNLRGQRNMKFDTGSLYGGFVQKWIISFGSVWITAAPITVDTFFFISGLLIVYTTAGKFSGIQLLKNLHLFYLNRLLRMFPVLATMILAQVSFLNWITDGPYWSVAMEQTHTCRVFWWSALLHVQNYVNPSAICLPHTWYLAIDVQLYILSPIVLFWVLNGKRKVAWTALVATLLLVLSAATTYNFVMDFPSAPLAPSRPDQIMYYFTRYYVNTLTRSSPFIVGMIFGYLMYLCRGKTVQLPKALVALLWICSTIVIALTVYAAYPIMQMDRENQLADSFINSFKRPSWAVAIGWLVFASQHGYGGPINWVLCLSVWKLLGRLSYAMYIVHYPLMIVTNAMHVSPIFFSVTHSIFKFMGDFMLTTLVAFIVTVFIDAPFSTIVKHFIGGGSKKPQDKSAALTNAVSIKYESRQEPKEGFIDHALNVNGSLNDRHPKNRKNFQNKLILHRQLKSNF